MLDELGRGLMVIAATIKNCEDTRFPIRDDEEQAHVFTVLIKANRSIQNHIPKIKEQLENEFRTILGEVANSVR